MTDSTSSHQTFMQRALELAAQGRGRTTPNPAVGAVIVKDGQIVGEGFHPKAGMPHAAAGIRRVFVAMIDRDPRVSGAGITLLREGGIAVDVGLCQEQAADLIAGFSKHLRSGQPWTIYKAAMTLDGHTATAVGDSRWISCEESRLRVHRLRNRVEAIMVGIETVLKDDPLLNVRLPHDQTRDPLRVVVDSHLRFPLRAKMLTQSSSAPTLIATCCADQARISRLTAAGAEVVVLPADQEGRVDLVAVWNELGRRQVQHLLLEGGSTLATAAWKACLIDELMVFVAPRLVGGCPSSGLFAGVGASLMADSAMLADVTHETSGSDLLIKAKVQTCLLD